MKNSKFNVGVQIGLNMRHDQKVLKLLYRDKVGKIQFIPFRVNLLFSH
jgi:hypothetical protein